VTVDGGEFLSEGRVAGLFEDMVRERRKSCEVQVFLKSWCYDAALRLYRTTVREECRVLLPVPTKEAMGFVLREFDPDPESGLWNSGGTVWLKTVGTASQLLSILYCAFKHCYMDRRNKWGQTCLQVACFENSCDSHYDVIYNCVEKHSCDAHALDMNGKTAHDLLLIKKVRLGEASGSVLREEVIFERREEMVGQMWDDFIQREKESGEKRCLRILEACCVESDRHENEKEGSTTTKKEEHSKQSP